MMLIGLSSEENRMVQYNLDGAELEKAGRVDDAVALYLYNVEHRFQGNYPYDRLAIIYRKAKSYDKEVYILKRAIDVFENDVIPDRPDRDRKIKKFKDRLAKAEKLKESTK